MLRRDNHLELRQDNRCQASPDNRYCQEARRDSHCCQEAHLDIRRLLWDLWEVLHATLGAHLRVMIEAHLDIRRLP